MSLKEMMTCINDDECIELRMIKLKIRKKNMRFVEDK